VNRLEAWRSQTRPPTAEELGWCLTASGTLETDSAIRFRLLAARRRLTAPDVATRWPTLRDDHVLMAAAIRLLLEQNKRPTPA
jgi:hypothetical protein